MGNCSWPKCSYPTAAKGLCDVHYRRQLHGYPMDAPFKRMLRGLSLEETLLTRIEYEPNSGCWLWTGSLDTHGYGMTKKELAHRASYRTFVGPIPPGKHICHRCDTRPCINPFHLFPGTNAENIADMCKKERNQRGERNGSAKITADDVMAIRKMKSDGVRQADMARQFGVTPAHINAIVYRRKWKHL